MHVTLQPLARACDSPSLSFAGSVTVIDDLSGESASDDLFNLTRRRRLALCAVLGVVLLLFVTPAVLAAWSVLDTRGLDRAVAGFEPISHLAVLLQVGRFPLLLVLISWLARSPSEW